MDPKYISLLSAFVFAAALLSSCDTATDPRRREPPTPPDHSTAHIELPDTLRFPSFASRVSPDTKAVFGNGDRVLPSDIRWIIDDTTVVDLESAYNAYRTLRAGFPGTTRVIVEVATQNGRLAADTAIAVVDATVVGLEIRGQRAWSLLPGDTAHTRVNLVDQVGNVLYSPLVPDSVRNSYVWETGDSSVVAVDSAGVLKGVGAGVTWLRVVWQGVAEGSVAVSVPLLLPDPPIQVLATSEYDFGFSGSYAFNGRDTITVNDRSYRGASKLVSVDISGIVGDGPFYVSRPDSIATNDDGVQFRVGEDNSLSAYAPDGSRIWRIDYLPGKLTVAGDRLIVRHLYQNMVSAVSVADGTLLWQTEEPGLADTGYTPMAALITRDGRVVIGPGLYFFDLETGRYLGRTEKAVGTPLFILDDFIFGIHPRALSVATLK